MKIFSCWFIQRTIIEFTLNRSKRFLINPKNSLHLSEAETNGQLEFLNLQMKSNRDERGSGLGWGASDSKKLNTC